MMTQFAHRIVRLARDRQGAISIEFAFSILPLAMLMVAIMEFGMIQFTSVLMESGLRDAARYGITGYAEEDENRIEHIVEIISERTLGLVDLSAADLHILVYPSFGEIESGEDFVDGNGNGVYDNGETFTDANGNGVWDDDIGSEGAGDSGDIVVYRIEYDWPLMTPFASTFIGTDGTFPIRASLAVRNEPWDTDDEDEETEGEAT